MTRETAGSGGAGRFVGVPGYGAYSRAISRMFAATSVLSKGLPGSGYSGVRSQG